MPYRLFLFACVFAVPAAGAAEPPRPFLPGIVSTASIESDIAFAPDGRTLYFSRRDGAWGGKTTTGVILMSRKRAGGWTTPEPAPFSGPFDDSDPFVSLDGRWLYFISTRPDTDKPEPDPDIWRVPIIASGFGVPERLPEPVNSPGVEYSPVTVANGALYFASTRKGGHGQGDLYRAAALAKGIAAPRNLGPVINSKTGEWNLYVSPTENLLLFEASSRADNTGAGSGDLYGAVKVNGAWGKVRNLRRLNTKGSDLMPRIFPHDPDHLYYASTGFSGHGFQADIFRVHQALVGLEPPAGAH